MPPQSVATADIPPPPVLSQDQLRLMPGGMKLNSISPDLTGIARTEKFTAPNTVPLTPAVGTIPAGGVPPNVRANVGMTNAAPDSPIRAQTVQYWIGQGVNPQAAEGIADALQPESGFNPGAYTGNDNGAPSGGIYQHHGERLERLQKYAASQDKSWTDPTIQHQFANLERQSGNPYTDQIVAQHWQEIANAPDRATAKALWQRYFERGVLQGGAGGMGIPYANEQQAAAQAIQVDLYGASDRARKQADGFMSEVKDFKKDLAGSLQRIHEARGRSDEAIAKATEAANYQPKPPLIDGFANLGSLGAIIGMMGGLLTKSPMIASLNAGAAAIEAANRGDMAQYERAYDSWKTNSDMLFKIVDLQQKRAQEIMGDEKFMTEEKRVGLDLYLRAIGQEQLADKLRIEGTQFGYDYFKTMGAATEKYDENRIKLQENHEQHRATQEMQQMRLRETVENDRMRNERSYERNDISRDRVNQTGELGTERNQIARDRVNQIGELGAERNQIARDRVDQTGKLGTERNQIARDRITQTGELGWDRDAIARERIGQTGELGHERNDIARDRVDQTGRLGDERNNIARDRLDQTGRLGDERNDIARGRLDQNERFGEERIGLGRDRLDQNERFGTEKNQIARDRVTQTGELGRERNDIARNRLEQSGTMARERNEIARDRLKQAEQKDPGRSYYYDWRNKYIEEHDGEAPPEELDSKRFQEFQRFYPKASASGQKELSVPMSDDAIDMSARRSLKGDHSAVVGLGYGTVGANNRTKINNRMSELAKEMGISPEQVAAMQLEFAGRRTEIQALGRRQAVLDSAVVEAQTLMPQVIQTSENVSRTRFTDINTILLSGERRTGDPNVVRFGIALNSFINVYARAMNPTGVPTVSDKEHARALLATNWTKGQIQAAMDQLGVEMNAAYRASDTVWRDIIARTASNEPRGPEFLKQMSGGAGGGANGATGAQTWPTPSPAAIKALKDDPALRQDFESTFGPENTRKYLGQ